MLEQLSRCLSCVAQKAGFSCITPSSHVQPTLGACPGLNGLCNLVSLADSEEATAKAAHAAETAAALAELPGVFTV